MQENRIETAPHSVQFILDLADACATDRLARKLAPACKAGDVILLHGPVGAGKSHFARALIRALTVPDEDVPSPTFTLVQTYEAAFEIWHLDLYRLSDIGELEELGFLEAMDDALCLIEWPERLGSLTPLRAFHLTLTPVAATADHETRHAEITLLGERWDEMKTLISQINIEESSCQ